jgi:serine/threonine-protein kinase
MQPTTERTGRYHLQELIAAGGMGEVWRAVDEVLGRPVAVKLLRPEYSRDELTLLRFRAEARHAGGLNHPGIAQVYDYEDATRDRPAYLVMELVSGPSLAGVLAGGQLDARHTADVLAQAAEALHAAHTAGVLHRDIKPGNLLIGPGGQVKVTDFGIAQSSRTGNLTRTGSLVGTTGYLAPERVSGRPATVASDLYALGIVGYECLTGHPPFQGEPLQVALAHRDQDLPGLPPWCLSQPGGAGLAALITRLTAKDPAGRPATAALVAEEARRIGDGFTGPGDFPAPTRPDQVPPLVAASPAPAAGAAPPAAAGSAAPPAGAARPVPPAPARPRRHRLAAAGLAAGVLAVGLLGWLLATAGSHPSPGSPAQGHPARSAVSVRTVGVSTSLLGRPVSVVRRELRGLGLVVRVRPQPDQQAAPGSVVRIHPTGQVPVGSVVLLTAATRPARSAPASTHPAPTPPASGTPAPSASPTATSTTSSSPGRAKHSKGPPPGHG